MPEPGDIEVQRPHTENNIDVDSAQARLNRERTDILNVLKDTKYLRTIGTGDKAVRIITTPRYEPFDIGRRGEPGYFAGAYTTYIGLNSADELIQARVMTESWDAKGGTANAPSAIENQAKVDLINRHLTSETFRFDKPQQGLEGNKLVISANPSGETSLHVEPVPANQEGVDRVKYTRLGAVHKLNSDYQEAHDNRKLMEERRAARIKEELKQAA